MTLLQWGEDAGSLQTSAVGVQVILFGPWTVLQICFEISCWHLKIDRFHIIKKNQDFWICWEGGSKDLAAPHHHFYVANPHQDWVVLAPTSQGKPPLCQSLAHPSCYLPMTYEFVSFNAPTTLNQWLSTFLEVPFSLERKKMANPWFRAQSFPRGRNLQGLVWRVIPLWSLPRS